MYSLLYHIFIIRTFFMSWKVGQTNKARPILAYDIWHYVLAFILSKSGNLQHNTVGRWVVVFPPSDGQCLVWYIGNISVRQSPSQSAPAILKNRAPCFLKIGHPAFCKKQAEKNRVILYSKREETRLPLLFLNYNDLGFLHSVFFKKQGARFSKSRVPYF